MGEKKRQRKDFTHKVEIVTINDKGRKNQSPVVNTFAVPERQRERGELLPLSDSLPSLEMLWRTGESRGEGAAEKRPRSTEPPLSLYNVSIALASL